MESIIPDLTCIIVLVHNKIDVTKQFLTQLFENTYEKHYHLVIVDNGSTDGTSEYLATLDKDNIHIISLKYNSGVIDGRNLGYERSKHLDYDYLLFLDNDQFVEKEWLEQHIFFMKQGDYDVLGVEAWEMSESFRPLWMAKNPTDVYTYVGAGGMILKRKVVKEIGLFDTSFSPMYFEDPDYCFQCNKRGFHVGWNPHARITHKPHQTMSIISQEDKHKYFRRSLKYFREKWNNYNPPIHKRTKMRESLRYENKHHNHSI
ncbi:MAG: glycosyltransferase [Candidatus Scalindua sp.]|jgi:O-antigen biosynthesis protein|nr:glycosyltransferase [Candidatus Scalindua sp.]